MTSSSGHRLGRNRRCKSGRRHRQSGCASFDSTCRGVNSSSRGCVDPPTGGRCLAASRSPPIPSLPGEIEWHSRPLELEQQRNFVLLLFVLCHFALLLRGADGTQLLSFRSLLNQSAVVWDAYPLLPAAISSRAIYLLLLLLVSRLESILFSIQFRVIYVEAHLSVNQVIVYPRPIAFSSSKPCVSPNFVKSAIAFFILS